MNFKTVIQTRIVNEMANWNLFTNPY